MKHLNPHRKRWNQQTEEDKYWFQQAIDCGGKMQYLYAQEKRWIDRLPEFPRNNSRHIYRICPDYRIAVHLKDMKYRPEKQIVKQPEPEPEPVKKLEQKFQPKVRKWKPATKKPVKKKVKTKAVIKRSA